MKSVVVSDPICVQKFLVSQDPSDFFDWNRYTIDT